MQALRTGHRDGLVKEMDPDAVNRESGKGLATDDAVSSLEFYVRGRITLIVAFFPYARTTIKALYRRYTATSVQADSGMPLTCAGRRTSPGGPQVFVVHDCFRGGQFVGIPVTILS
jgi:hypothetical protein